MSSASYMEMARFAAMHGRCSRRKIGAVIINGAGDVIAQAANGTPFSMKSCLENPCPGANVPAGSGNAGCYGTHAERNALLQCNASEVHAIYCTKAPCRDCVLMLLNTPCQLIVFETPSNETINQELWQSSGRTWMQLNA
jgi:dCMP deaminase